MSEIIGATIAVLVVIGGLLLVIINQIYDHWRELESKLDEIVFEVTEMRKDIDSLSLDR